MPSVLGARANPDAKDLVHQDHRHIACVVVGKTTVCRIFSCQRSDGDYVPKPLATAPRGPRCPTPRPRGAHVRAQATIALRLGCQSSLSLPTHSRLTRNRSTFAKAIMAGQPSPFWLACQPKLMALSSHERRLVENTGLEPVTSWLQTRRSPS